MLVSWAGALIFFAWIFWFKVVWPRGGLCLAESTGFCTVVAPDGPFAQLF